MPTSLSRVATPHVAPGTTTGQARVASGPETRPVVLYVSAVADNKGGAETVLLEMLRNPFVIPHLAVPGHGVLRETALRHGIPVHLFDLGAVAQVRRPPSLADILGTARDAVRAAMALAAIARQAGATLVHTNGLKVHVVGCLARLLRGTPTIIHMHDIAYNRQEKLLWRLLAATAAHTVAASDLCYPAAPATGLSPRLSIVPQGVDAPPATGPRLLPPRVSLGFVGRIHAFKGVHHLIDWFEAVQDEYPQADLLLRGRVSDEGAAYWAALLPRVERLIEAGRCRVEDWRPAGEDPLEGIDILVAPSSTPEVGPRVVMEAMLRGIPAIGYPAGGILRMIPSPALGAHAADAEAFRAALGRLLDPATYAAISAAALEHASREFGIRRFWRELAGAYAAATAGHARAAR